MRFPLAIAAVAVVAVVGTQSVLRSDDRVAPPPSAAATTPPPPGGAGVLDHEDDYSAPAEELVEHADHLDVDRLPPDTRREIEAELARRDAIATELWAVYGSALTGDPSRTRPPAVEALGAYELGYLLMAARAEQLASVVLQSGGLPEALALPATGADHADVAVTLEADCVTVALAQDPFARAFGARVLPRGSGDLASRLTSRVRVDAAGGPACGGAPVALSPDAELALSALGA